MTQYLDYGLKAAGFEVICMEARQVKAALAAMRNKTDRHDARGIAQILRSGWYSPVHVKSLESYQIRALLSSRKAVLAKCVDLENEIRGLFKIFGIKLPPRLGHGSFDAHVRGTIEADEALSHALRPLLNVRLELYRAFRELDNRTRKLAHGDEVCRRLMTAPGVRFVVWMKPKLSTVLKARPKAWLSTPSDQCPQRADYRSVPTAKRSVTHAVTPIKECHNKRECDINAR